MQFRQLDLNLLVVFRSLMLHRSLTRVADELGLTQPAISHALKKLRAHYNDELFVRSGSGMEPTPRALDLFEPISRALEHIYSTFEEDIDPKTISFELKIGFVEYESVFFLPILDQKFQHSAPGIKLSPDRVKLESAIDLLKRNKLDLIIGDLLDDWIGIHRCVLFREPFVAVTGSMNPICNEVLSLKGFEKQSHIKLPIYRRVVAHLQSMGLDIDYAAHTDNILSVPSMVTQSPLIAIVPKTFADVFKQLHEVREVSLAFDLPEVVVDAAYSSAKTSDPIFRWINECIEAIGYEIREKLASKAATDWRLPG